MNPLTDQNFEDTIVNAENPILVDFWAEWCPPCKKLTPILEAVQQKYEGKVDFYKVNVDENPMLGQSFKIEVIPTVILFKNKSAANAFVGLKEEQEVIDWLEQHI